MWFGHCQCGLAEVGSLLQFLGLNEKKIIAGNWKMNKTVEEAIELADTLKPEETAVDVVYVRPLQLFMR